MSSWQTKKLGDVAAITKGKGISKSDITENGQYKCVHYGELFIKYGEIIKNVRSRTDRNDDVLLSIPNDVLMPTSDVTPRGLATASYLPYGNVVIGGDILVIRPNDKELDGRFFAYYVAADKHSILRLTTGSTIFHLYGSDMRKLKLTLPKKQEQERIVAVLEVWGEYIEKLERKIALKEQLKKGLMQQLLTGSRRLPGFNKEWTRMQYRDLCKFQSGFAFSSDDFSEDTGIRLIRNRDLKGAGGDLFYKGNSAPEQYTVKDGDILIGMDGDFIAHTWSGGTALLNQRVGRLVDFVASDPSFIYYFSQRDLKQIENETSSTTVKHLSAKEFEKRDIVVPDHQEQIEIGRVLSSCDDDIALLKNKKISLLKQKKYLLKNLITGKIRTPETLKPKGAK